MHIHILQEKNARLTGRAGTHYLWEFLMLFLAVFCGFLAESELKLFYNDVAMKEETMKNYNFFLRWAKETAEVLMIQIEDEYHFKK